MLFRSAKTNSEERKRTPESSGLGAKGGPATGVLDRESPERPSLDRKTLIDIYHQMVLVRRFEEKAAEIYSAGKIGGFCHLYIGQEAVAIGAISAVRKDDYAVTSYREHAHAIACKHGARSRARHGGPLQSAGELHAIEQHHSANGIAASSASRKLAPLRSRLSRPVSRGVLRRTARTSARLVFAPSRQSAPAVHSRDGCRTKVPVSFARTTANGCQESAGSSAARAHHFVWQRSLLRSSRQPDRLTPRAGGSRRRE